MKQAREWGSTTGRVRLIDELNEIDENGYVDRAQSLEFSVHSCIGLFHFIGYNRLDWYLFLFVMTMLMLMLMLMKFISSRKHLRQT